MAGIGLTDFIFPFGNFPILEDIYIKGGFRALADTVARDAIPTLDRKVGMRVATQADLKVWRLGPGLTNADWIDTGAGAAGTVTNVSVTAANGFTGTVLNPATTPAISLGTSISGVLVGAAGALTLAAAGATTDFAIPAWNGAVAGNLRNTNIKIPSAGRIQSATALTVTTDTAGVGLSVTVAGGAGNAGPGGNLLLNAGAATVGNQPGASVLIKASSALGAGNNLGGDVLAQPGISLGTSRPGVLLVGPVNGNPCIRGDNNGTPKTLYVGGIPGSSFTTPTVGASVFNSILTTITANASVATGEFRRVAPVGANDFTVTLPNAASSAGQHILLMKTATGSANTFTLNVSGGTFINGFNVSILLGFSNNFVQLYHCYSDGITWWVTQSSAPS